MHVRFPRAAVAIESAGSFATTAAANRAPIQVRWATRPLVVRAGRVVAVRQRDGVVQLGIVAKGATTLKWVDPSSVLSEAQIQMWERNSSFVP
jgi:hypothetical protein